MMISTKGKYALKMMIDIAENGNNGWISVKEVSERQGISDKYLEQIVVYLKKAGLLRSGRGSSGGHMLSKPPTQYTVGEILRAMEGKLAPVTCLEDEINQCERNKFCKTLEFWMGLHKVINDYVDSVTLQELIESDNGY
jgi:Rrf2 family protein